MDILILGWAFKPETNDSRESPSIYVAEKLYKTNANILVFDPKVTKGNILNDIHSKWDKNLNIQNSRFIILDKLEKIPKVDAVAIITDWEYFKQLEFNKGIKVFNGVKFQS